MLHSARFHSLILMAILWGTPWCVPVKADCDIAGAVFDVTPADEKYLEYLRYENRFDSATVAYTIGEIRVVHDNQEQRVLLGSFPNEFRRQDGSTEQGIDTKLEALGRTETFSAAGGDEVHFYRELSAYTPCDVPGGSGSGGQRGDWTDYYWKVGTGRILDQTEFVLHIVRDSDGAVLGTLDSVVVQPNATTVWAPRQGTFTDQFSHSRVMPAWIPSGTKVYLRVSPRRFGPTPLGMVMNKIDSWVSLSTLYERTPVGISRCEHTHFDSLKALHFQKVLDFTDHALLATGYLPGNGRRVRMSAVQRALYNQRYLLLDTVVAGRSSYRSKDSATFAAQYWGGNLKGGSFVQPRGSFAIRSITPNPAHGTTIAVLLDNVEAFPGLTLELYDLGGRRIAELWSGRSTAGAIEVGIDGIYGGTYMLVLSADDGTRLDARQLVIAH